MGKRSYQVQLAITASPNEVKGLGGSLHESKDVFSEIASKYKEGRVLGEEISLNI